MPQIDGRSLAQALSSDRDAVMDRWIALIAASARGRITSEELTAELRPILDALVEGLSAGDVSLSAPSFEPLCTQLSNLSRSRAIQGFSPSETATSVFALKQAVLNNEQIMGSAEFDFVTFSLLLDELGLLTFETYATARDRVITQQAEELLELSTPVVKLWDGIVAVPLIGTLDSARAQVVTEKLLQTLVDTGASHAIIDITGVPAVDTQVAQHLLKTVVAARLMGAECIISGIRPQIAQTIVALGIEFGDVATKAGLSDALQLALHSAGVTFATGKAR